MKERGFELIFTKRATADEALAEFRKGFAAAQEISSPVSLVAVVDYNKCHPEKCSEGICAAIDACPVKAIKQGAPYELPKVVQSVCEGYGYCVEACPLKALRLTKRKTEGE